MQHPPDAFFSSMLLYSALGSAQSHRGKQQNIVVRLILTAYLAKLEPLSCSCFARASCMKHMLFGTMYCKINFQNIKGLKAELHPHALNPKLANPG